MNGVKSETSQILRVYGAIDQRVQVSPEAAERVAALLPAYEDPGPPWSDAFPKWTAGLEGDAEGAEGLSMLTTALDDFEPMELNCRLPARRMFALGAAALAFHPALPAPGLEADGLRERFVNALTFRQIDGGQEAAERMVQYLLGETALESSARGAPRTISAWWSGLLEIAPVDRADIGPPPCATGLVWVTLDGDDEPVATFTTEFDVALPFDTAVEFCDPERWKCFPLWCGMKDLEPDKHDLSVVHRYLETVSLDCAHPGRSRVFSINLDFVRTDDRGPPRVAVTEYALSDDNQEPRVEVNEGSLVITELAPDKVRIKTTKRLRFSDPLDGAAFASVLCHVGYMSNVEDLICCATDPDWRAAWPGRERGHRRRRTSPGAVDEDFRGLMTFTMRRTEAALLKWLNDYEKAYKRSARQSPSPASRRRGEDCYTGADLLQDAFEMWSLALSQAPKLAGDVGLRGARGESRAQRRTTERSGRSV